MRRGKHIRPNKVAFIIAFVLIATCLAVFVSALDAQGKTDTGDEITAPSPVIKEVVIEKPVPVVEYVMIPYERTWADDDLFYLAVAIYQEAGGDSCSDETRIRIGNVILNRCNDPRFPDTIYDVLMAESQWGTLHWIGIVFPDRAFTQEEAHAVSRAYDCARRVLDGEKFLEDDVIWAAEFEQGETVLHQDGFYFGR